MSSRCLERLQRRFSWSKCRFFDGCRNAMNDSATCLDGGGDYCGTYRGKLRKLEGKEELKRGPVTAESEATRIIQALYPVENRGGR